MDQTNLDTLLAQWEETYKKGLLSFWLLLLLAQRKAYPYEIKAAINAMSHNTINADENSIYRSLNRLADSGIVASEVQPSETGPSRQVFLPDQPRPGAADPLHHPQHPGLRTAGRGRTDPKNTRFQWKPERITP